MPEYWSDNRDVPLTIAELNLVGHGSPFFGSPQAIADAFVRGELNKYDKEAAVRLISPSYFDQSRKRVPVEQRSLEERIRRLEKIVEWFLFYTAPEEIDETS